MLLELESTVDVPEVEPVGSRTLEVVLVESMIGSTVGALVAVPVESSASGALDLTVEPLVLFQ